MTDVGAGHDVRASLFVQCRTGYRTDGPEALRPVVRSPGGLGTTNCAFGGPEGRTLFITESDSGSILKAEFPKEMGIAGAPIFSGAL